MSIPNKTMPIRPREHQLESESRTALRSRIPYKWVYRDKTHDYGVDGEIEIFDESNSATGLLFLVQLKATDESNIKKALNVRLKETTFGYLHSLGLPILIVLYHAPSQQIYIHWLHNFEHYFSRTKTSSLSLRLSPDDKWTDSTPGEIVEAIRSFREFRSPTLPYPIDFQLMVRGASIRGIKASDLIFGLRKAAERCRTLICITTGAATPKGRLYRLEIDSNEVKIILAGYHAFLLRTKAKAGEEETIETFVSDIMICIAVALSWYGHNSCAASLISEFVHESRIGRTGKLAFPVAISLAQADQVKQSLEIAESIFKENADFQVAQAYLIPFFTNRRNLSHSILEFALHILSTIEMEAIKHHIDMEASVVNYNMANILRGLGRFPESISRYKRTARLNADYLKRAYFWSELGSIMFLRRHYATAAAFYNRSLEISSSAEIRLLYADALMFSGRYSEAQFIFEEYLKTPEVNRDAEWILKYCVLRWLRNRLGIDTQIRIRSVLLNSFCPAVMEAQEIERTCELVIRDDALSQLAWFNLAVMMNKKENSYGAMMGFLTSALLKPADYESWRNVLFLSMNLSYHCIFLNALALCFKYHGNDFLKYLTQQFPENNDLMASLLINFADSLPKGQSKATERYHNPQINWDQILIDDRMPSKRSRKRASQK
jgi:tetratricopeptide (TPR) repeat protein